MKNIPIVTFLARTWMLFVAMLVFNWLAVTEIHFKFLGKWEALPNLGGVWVAATPLEFCGPILWIVPFGLAVILLGLLIVHLYYRATIDYDAQSGKYLADWQACSPYERVLVSNIVRIGIFIGLCILCSSLARGEVDQVKRWDDAIVKPQTRMALDVEMALYRRNQSRYEAIQNMRPNGVPAPILFCLHYRESDNNFKCHAHEGSSLMHRTKYEPKGRPLHPEPPYTFEISAEDAYYVFEKPTLDKIDWKNKQASLDKMESFNGYGYRAKGIPAPYLWSGTSLYVSGKYVSDGVFSRTAVDKQLGCAAILKGFQARGVELSFTGWPKAQQ